MGNPVNQFARLVPPPHKVTCVPARADGSTARCRYTIRWDDDGKGGEEDFDLRSALMDPDREQENMSRHWGHHPPDAEFEDRGLVTPWAGVAVSKPPHEPTAVKQVRNMLVDFCSSTETEF